MKKLAASLFLSALATAGTLAHAQTSSGGDASKQPCTMGYVTGIGGAAASMSEYLATPDRDKFRYLSDHPIQCKVNDDGRATDCTGVINLRREEVSVYDDSDSTTMSVVTKVDLDRGTYPAIIVVRKQDVQCGE